ncbi:MAG: DUF4111 domain-containing protein [Lachnospiraceae bacterium]|nr:DUF4111 domain-containing protein [Lachnospiraceae bacterium]
MCSGLRNEEKMDEYQKLLHDFIAQSRAILKENLVGLYLHGSAAMGCFHPKKSDIDLLVVIKESMTNEKKRQYMDMVVELNKRAPEKGIELSIVKEEVCKPFVYPTPFELHFSITHLHWYQSNPEEYVEKMKGTDKDLAAHVTITYNRGQVLCGKEISSVFAEVSPTAYMDSIWSDIENAAEDILENPVYVILNLCRVLAYKKERLIVSKQEGGDWGMKHISQPEYRALVLAALEAYQTGKTMVSEGMPAQEFAEYMLEQIKK